MSEKSIVYMNTVDAYDQWARVYDTDGNVLQAIDDLQLETLLAAFIHLADPKRDLKVIDFGAGTGRNTVKLECELRNIPNTKIWALDASKGMLQKAKERCQNSNCGQHVEFLEYDAYKIDTLPQQCLSADMLISTLVAEHMPLNVFFENLQAMVKPGGYALITNMHSDMGEQSQAGFVENGVKVRPTSFPHSAQQMLQVGEKYGFEPRSLDGNLLFVERGITKQDLDQGLFGGWDGRGKKWINNGMLWFGLCLRRKLVV